MLHKEVVLRNFVNCTGKHMRWILFFNEVAGLMFATGYSRKNNREGEGGLRIWNFQAYQRKCEIFRC